MKLHVKDLDLSTGGTLVVVVSKTDAVELGLHKGDRVGVVKGTRHVHALVDHAETDKAVRPGEVGLFKEVLESLGTRQREVVQLVIEKKPIALKYIKEKLGGKELSSQEIYEIIDALVDGKLSDVELAYFVAAGYMNGFSSQETVYLTRAMIETGDVLHFPHAVVADKHCTGGVAGNRTTLVIVPILAAAGMKVPKTSSRAITSPAGTADTMEVLAPVNIPIEKMKRIVKKVGACIVWGGSMNLAPADDKIIQVERTLSIDAEGQLLASILAKKGSVGSTHVLIDIPVGKETKIQTEKEALHLARKFAFIGKKLGMRIEVVTTSGNEPIGNGIGPALEAKDVLKVLQRSDTRPLDLEEKSVMMAGKILEMANVCKKGHGGRKAQELLDNKEALYKMKAIIHEQGGNANIHSSGIKVGQYTYDYKAKRDGMLKDLNNRKLARVAKFAGAPLDKGAGIFLHKHEKEVVMKGDVVLAIHAENKRKLQFAKKLLSKGGVIIE